jgi:magnesium chelatase subunit D
VSPWARAARAAALFALDPSLGLWLHAGHGPVRDMFLELLRSLFAPETPWRKAPLGVGDERLLGGLDVAATLAAGRPVVQSGLLAEVDGGVLTLTMAERIAASAAARICAVMDSGTVALARDGFAREWPTRFGVLALDEGVDDETPPGALADRLGLMVDLTGLSIRDIEPVDIVFDDVEAARARGADADERALATLAAVAARCGIVSLRAPLFALRAARGLAALEGRALVSDEDLALAAALTIAPRALTAPDGPPPEEPPAPEDPAPEDQENQAEPPPDPQQEIDPQEDIVLAAVLAALPQGLLERLGDPLRASKGGSAGKSGATRASRQRGRPMEPRAGSLRDGRLALLATLRAAAPWQKLRTATPGQKLRVTPDDVRIRRFRENRGTVAVFVVDASGSQAARRLGEVKGAVERLLADCYVRRDSVALVAFRGKTAEIVLPPTRSLARARKTLAGLPGGGGTPLASGLALGLELAERIQRKGETPLLVLLTDGRANIARDGLAERERANTEATAAARAVRVAGIKALTIDSAAPARRGEARALAQAMGALYVPLPFADSGAINRAVRAAAEV